MMDLVTGIEIGIGVGVGLLIVNLVVANIEIIAPAFAGLALVVGLCIFAMSKGAQPQEVAVAVPIFAAVALLIVGLTIGVPVVTNLVMDRFPSARGPAWKRKVDYVVWTIFALMMAGVVALIALDH